MHFDPQSQIARDARILIVDDEEINILGLKRLLDRAGYAICISVTDPRRAVAQFIDMQPDIVLLDLHMAPISGLQVLQSMCVQSTPETMPPVLVLTADTSAETRIEAFKAGATDFLSKPFDHTEVLMRIKNLLQLRMLWQKQQLHTQELEERVRARTAELEHSVQELREVQQQVIQQERLRALGVMAGGVAHDFNNVLMVIRGYCDMFLEQRDLCRSEAEVRESFQIISSAAADAGEIVRRLREFYRPYSKGEDDRRPILLNEIVSESVQLSRPKWETDMQARGVLVDLDLQLGKLPQVPAAAAEVREVLLNLMFNAIDAMPQGGRLSIRTGVEGEMVMLQVADSGTGMTDETRLHCLEPFYTTKGQRGSGLGLAIIYGIVRRHGGQIRIHTELNKGTTVTVLLPIQEIVEESADATDGQSVLRGLRVLVVDDQPRICVVLRHYLQMDSHTVVTAGNGCEAIEKFQQESFDLVITDRVMPKMSGDQLAAAIKEMNPEKPVILLTAFAENRDAPSDVDLLLSKPASLRSLREAIGKVLAAA